MQKLRCKIDMECGHVRLSYEPYYFSERTVFFSYNKSANEQYFSLTTNQRTVLSAMAFQQSEQGLYRHVNRWRQEDRAQAWFLHGA